MNHNSYNAILLNTQDNVVCLLKDLRAGDVPAVGQAIYAAILQDTAIGHKIAVSKIQRGAHVVKFGTPIGTATRDIEPGEHVHLHNLTGLSSTKGRVE